MSVIRKQAMCERVIFLISLKKRLWVSTQNHLTAAVCRETGRYILYGNMFTGEKVYGFQLKIIRHLIHLMKRADTFFV